MTELTAVAETPNLSTTLDTNPTDATRNGGGEVRKEPEKPESIQDSIRSVIREADDKEAAAKEEKEDKGDKPEAKTKPVPEPKKADGEGEKAAKPQTDKVTPDGDKSAAEKPAAGQDGNDSERQSEGRKHIEPPARFLPDARTKWANVPNEVKAEVNRVAQEYEAEIEKGRASSERYERIRAVDEQLKGQGVELIDRINQLNNIGLQIQRNPVAGLEMLLRDVGPRKPDGSPVSLYELAQSVARLTPQQFAQNMGNMGQQPQQQRQQQVDPNIAAITKKLESIEQRFAVQQATPLLSDFAAKHPDYEALAPSIAAILKSGIIENVRGTGLSPEQKLAEAYRMAGGRGPSSQSEPPQAALHPEAPRDRPVDPAGQKSITGAPNGGEDPPDDADEDTDIRSLLRKGMRKTV